jgi:hypothetical protein
VGGLEKKMRKLVGCGQQRKHGIKAASSKACICMLAPVRLEHILYIYYTLLIR